MRVLLLCALFFGVAANAAAAPDMTVAQFRAAPPGGKIVRLTGYMVDAYLCPPCPPGAMCKPCMSHSSITIADEPNHIQGAPEITVAVPDPAPFKRGVRYRFEIAADADGGLDGRVLRSQPAREPAWPSP
jgi:hypothetical protein